MKKEIILYTFSILLCMLILPDHILEAEDRETHLLSPDERQALLQSLDEFQDRIKTFQADFVEFRRIAELKSPLQYKGTLYYQVKGLFLMHYKSPLDSILLVRKDKALFYVKGSRSADLVDFSGLKGVAEHRSMFVWDPSKFSGKIWEGPSGYMFKGSRNNEQSAGEEFTIILDQESLLVKRLSIRGPSGDATEIVLSNREINTPLPPWVADFSLPEGVEVNKMDPH